MDTEMNLAIQKRCDTDMSEALRASREERGFLMQAGMAYCEARQFQEARDVFHGLAALDPKEPLAEIGLGSVCFGEGRFGEATAHYRAALKLSPSNAYAFALLGEAQVFQENYVAARTSLRRAQQLDGNGRYGTLANNLLKLVDCLQEQESSH